MPVIWVRELPVNLVVSVFCSRRGHLSQQGVSTTLDLHSLLREEIPLTDGQSAGGFPVTVSL